MEKDIRGVSLDDALKEKQEREVIGDITSLVYGINRGILPNLYA